MRTERPTVSIIVTTFNRHELLRDTLSSIIEQTFKDFELIVVDNFSDYDFFELISEFNDGRIFGFQNANHGVIAANRNFGISKARGDYIAFCDDDDLWYSKKLEKQVELLRKKVTIGLCSTNCTYINATPSTAIQKLRAGVLQSILAANVFPSKYTLIMVPYITNSSVMVRRSVIDNVGLLDENPTLRAFEDFDLWLRVSLNFPIFYMAEKLVAYRIHSHQASDENRSLSRMKLAQVFEKNRNAFNSIQKLLLWLTNK